MKRPWIAMDSEGRVGLIEWPVSSMLLQNVCDHILKVLWPAGKFPGDSQSNYQRYHRLRDQLENVDDLRRDVAYPEAEVPFKTPLSLIPWLLAENGFVKRKSPMVQDFVSFPNKNAPYPNRIKTSRFESKSS